MSRIGKKPVELPAGTSIQMEADVAVVKGPKGSLRVPLPMGINLERKDGHVLLGRASDAQAAVWLQWAE